MANVIIAVLATILGFTTSAVVAEVRGQDPAAAPLIVAEIPEQSRPIHVAEPPAFLSTRAPDRDERKQAVTLASMARAFPMMRSSQAR